ncbi:hypothetical protein PAF17_10545 [Paracoccus sp. Z330]|uniref:Phage tail tape measure protein n=1 Tax=Paracoccus onchidii TaxID=3017813 RepID=A0ABT4ZF07_9RHOB|nr:hypothetical protein [Paracoccus onchidii]MDB6177939.1 hypothetical protein [Paracoccus onchidii]
MAAGEAGVSLSTLTDAVQTMDREVARGSKNAVGALGQLGIAAADLDGKDADEKLALIADRIVELGISTGEASALLQDLGVRNREMLLAVMAGGDAFRNARRDVEEYGLALGSVDSDAIELANDRIGRLGLVGQYVGQQLAITIVPTLGRLAKAMTDSLREGGHLRSVIDGLTNNLQRLGTYVAVAVAGFGVRYVGAMVAARVATLSLSGALVALRGALIRTGIGALVVVAGELVYQFGRLVSAAGGFGEAMGQLGELSALVWQGIADSAQAIPPALAAVWANVKAGFLRFVGDLQWAWYSFLGSMSAGARDLGMGDVADSLQAQAAAAGQAWDGIAAKEADARAAASENAGRAAGAISEAFAPAAEKLRELRGMVAGTSEALDHGAMSAASFAGSLDDVATAASGGGAGGGGKSGGAAGALRDVGKATDQASEKADDFKASFGAAFEGIVTGSKTAREAISELLNGLSSVFANRAFEALWGGMAGGGGLLSSAFAAVGMPAYANGGQHAGGFRLVGERGPEIEATGAARYYSSAQTRDLLSGGTAQPSRSQIEIVPSPYFDARVKEVSDRSAADMGVKVSKSIPGQIQEYNRNPRKRF